MPVGTSGRENRSSRPFLSPFLVEASFPGKVHVLLCSVLVFGLSGETSFLRLDMWQCFLIQGAELAMAYISGVLIKAIS